MKFKPLVIWIWNQNIAISTIVGTSSHIKARILAFDKRWQEYHWHVVVRGALPRVNDDKGTSNTLETVDPCLWTLMKNISVHFDDTVPLTWAYVENIFLWYPFAIWLKSVLLLLPGKGRNSINECLCPVIKNFAGPREQTSLLYYTIKSSLEYIQC